MLASPSESASDARDAPLEEEQGEEGAEGEKRPERDRRLARGGSAAEEDDPGDNRTREEPDQKRPHDVQAERGSRRILLAAASLVRISRRWSMKSKSI